MKKREMRPVSEPQIRATITLRSTEKRITWTEQGHSSSWWKIWKQSGRSWRRSQADTGICEGAEKLCVYNDKKQV